MTVLVLTLAYIAIVFTVASLALAYAVRDAEEDGPVSGRTILMCLELGVIWPVTIVAVVVAVCLSARKERTHV